MSDPLLTIESLLFSYGRKPVLEKITLSVPRGEMILFAGANGAGKTTLLNLMAGVLPCPSHAVRFHVEPRKTAHIDTELSMYRSMLGKEAERLHRSLFHCRPLDWEKLSTMGIEPKTRLGELSRGQKALFRLHLALSQEPELLMIDEILSNLDPLFQEETGRLLVDLCGQGVTVIVVSQTPGEWQHLYTRLWLLKDTRMIVNESIETLLSQSAMEHAEEPGFPDWPILDRIHQDGLHQIVYHPVPSGSEGGEPVSLQQFIKSTLRSQAC